MPRKPKVKLQVYPFLLCVEQPERDGLGAHWEFRLMDKKLPADTLMLPFPDGGHAQLNKGSGCYLMEFRKFDQAHVLRELHRTDTCLGGHNRYGGVTYYDSYRLYAGNGTLLEQGAYKNGQAEGWTETYFPNGFLHTQQLYRNGKKDSIYREWTEAGTILTDHYKRRGDDSWYGETYYSNGVLQRVSKYEGENYVSREFNPQGILESEWRVYNTRTYHPNGALKAEHIYKQDHWEEKSYYASGVLERESSYVNSETPCGTWTYYSSKGELAKTVKYKSCKLLYEAGEKVTDAVADPGHDEYYVHVEQMPVYKKGGMDMLEKNLNDSLNWKKIKPAKGKHWICLGLDAEGKVGGFNSDLSLSPADVTMLSRLQFFPGKLNGRNAISFVMITIEKE